VSCPKCPFLVEKWCACGKEKLQSQPCHLQEARCGRVCGKKLKCGLHSCKKLCHRPGECEDANLAGKHCEQACGKTKLFCEHACQNTCHGPTRKFNSFFTLPAKGLDSQTSQPATNLRPAPPKPSYLVPAVSGAKKSNVLRAAPIPHQLVQKSSATTNACDLNEIVASRQL
jgi:hypothetical protein